MKPDAGDLGRPAYALGSVDKALRAIHMIRDGAPIRITDLSRDLGIGVSSAHRIMAMLVFHGFAVKDPQHRYFPGPALGAPVLMARDTDALISIAVPVLKELAHALDETANLSLRVGPHTRVLLAVETHGAAEMDRTGAVLPAYSTAAGRASLVHADAAALAHLFLGSAAERAGVALDDSGLQALRQELNRTRARGYAVSRNEAVKGISAAAVPVGARGSRSIAIAVLTPSSRFDSMLDDEQKMTLIREAAAVLAARLRVEK